MKHVRLSEVAEFINGRAFKPEEWETEGLPIIRIQNLTGSTDTINYYSGDVEQKYLVKDDDILISWSASLGVYRWQGGDAILNQHIFKVELKEKQIDKDYFYYAAQNALVEMERHIHGATMQHITRDPFLAIEIPLPPLTEQKRITSLLARADRLRALRRTAHELGESLLQSVFLEMFGDPKSDPKKWDLFELGEVVEINPTGHPKANPEQATSFLPMTLVDPSHIYSDMLDVKRFDEVSKGYTYFEENDVLFAKITPCMENGNIVISKNLLNGFGFGSTEFHVIRPNEKANAAWLYGFVKRPEFREEATLWFRGTAGQQRVPSDFLESYRVPLPPLNLQEEFAGMVARVESLQGRMSEAGRQVENLFESLLARSFGEYP